jgi:hypothetical protein
MQGGLGTDTGWTRPEEGRMKEGPKCQMGASYFTNLSAQQPQLASTQAL